MGDVQIAAGVLRHSTPSPHAWFTKKPCRLIVRQFPGAVQDEVNDGDGVTSTRDIVRGVLFSRDQLFGVKKLPICATTVGSRSTKTARGTCCPAPVSDNEVLREATPPNNLRWWSDKRPQSSAPPLLR